MAIAANCHVNCITKSVEDQDVWYFVDPIVFLDIVLIDLKVQQVRNREDRAELIRSLVSRSYWYSMQFSLQSLGSSRKPAVTVLREGSTWEVLRWANASEAMHGSYYPAMSK